MEISAAIARDVYEALGIDIARLGCIMLETSPVVVSDVIAEQDLYQTDSAEDPYYQPISSEPAAHVTLLHGLMRPGPEIRRHVDAMLSGWQPDDPKIAKINHWPGQETGGEYVSILAMLTVTDNLLEANARLRLLPHIDLYGTYQPHITLAHVKSESGWLDYINRLHARYVDTTVASRTISYGD
jgi:hypothetical protein